MNAKQLQEALANRPDPDPETDTVIKIIREVMDAHKGPKPKPIDKFADIRRRLGIFRVNPR